MNDKVLKLAVISGKGGVGKSMICAAFCLLFFKENNIIAVDCDVDAPNLAIWLNEMSEWQRTIPVNSFSKVKIDYDKCTNCSLCIGKCRFGAIEDKQGSKPEINNFLCDGCGACEAVCPHIAISSISIQSGEIKTKQTKYGFPLILGHLFSGEAGSSQIINEVKKEADKFENELQIIDSPPGIGGPVLATLHNVNFTVIIAEPTPSGFSDVIRVLEVIKKYKLPWSLIINKWDLNIKETEKISELVGDNLLGKISYDKGVMQATSAFIPIMETQLKVADEIKVIYNKLKERIAEQIF